MMQKIASLRMPITRSPEPVAARPMSRASSDRTAGEATLSGSQVSHYPCHPCDPWFLPGLFLNRGLHGFHGWAGRRGQQVGPERANQSVGATATRSLGLTAGTGGCRGGSGRRASPWRSPEHAAAPPMSRTSSDQAAGGTTWTSSRFSRYPCDPCDPRFIPGWFLDHGLHGFHGWAGHRGRETGPDRANQSVEATATRSLDSMVEPADPRGVCCRRASPWRSATDRIPRSP